MLDGMFGEMFAEQEKLRIEPLVEDAKAAIEDARLILSLQEKSEKIPKLDEFVTYAQQDSARLRNISDENTIESAKRSTNVRFSLLGLDDKTCSAITNAIYGR